MPPELAKLASSLRVFDIDEHLRQTALVNKVTRLLNETDREWELLLWDVLKRTEAVAWRDDIPFSHVMYIKADTWKPAKLFDVKSNDLKTRTELLRDSIQCPGTRFYYTHNTLPASNSLKIALWEGMEGRIFFDAPVDTPVLFELQSDGERQVWMGLTPMEIMTQRPGVLMASGRVVVGGLGLGWFLNEVCKKPDVTEVVVVDREKNLIDWLRPRIEAAYPAVRKKKVEWVATGIYHYAGNDTKPDTKYLLDIWPTFGGCDKDEEFASLKASRPPGTVWGWGENTRKEKRKS